MPGGAQDTAVEDLCIHIHCSQPLHCPLQASIMHLVCWDWPFDQAISALKHERMVASQGINKKALYAIRHRPPSSILDQQGKKAAQEGLSTQVKPCHDS